jgi:very-short-patch-repair endonuclease
MGRQYPTLIEEAAQRLRRQMAPCEKMLWTEVRARKLKGAKLRRQVPFDRFVLDFLCSESKLIIELDGDTHIGNEQKDEERDHHFQVLGYRVLRFTNDRVRNDLARVLKEIEEHL